ncbi:hypothetical protein FGB62_25g641 [Gracilaria domingensis]|nr:hypothetical protein FGB62_25g641 [Gracilaria domingensis]
MALNSRRNKSVATDDAPLIATNDDAFQSKVAAMRAGAAAGARDIPTPARHQPRNVRAGAAQGNCCGGVSVEFGSKWKSGADHINRGWIRHSAACAGCPRENSVCERGVVRTSALLKIAARGPGWNGAGFRGQARCSRVLERVHRQSEGKSCTAARRQRIYVLAGRGGSSRCERARSDAR